MSEIIYWIGFLTCILGSICIFGLLIIAGYAIWWKVYKYVKGVKNLMVTIEKGLKADQGKIKKGKGRPPTGTPPIH